MGSRHVRCKWNDRFTCIFQVPGPERCMHPPSYKTSGCRAGSLPQNYPARLPCCSQAKKTTDVPASRPLMVHPTKKEKLRAMNWFKTNQLEPQKKWRMDDLRWVSSVEAWHSGCLTVNYLGNVQLLARELLNCHWKLTTRKRDGTWLSMTEAKGKRAKMRPNFS